jgi:hypothetical protein
LVEQAADLLATSLVATDLEIASAAYERQVSEVVASDDDVAAYVERLEESADEDDELIDRDPFETLHEDGDLPSGEALAAELERFLREQHRGD